MPPTLPIAPATARRFLALRHYLAPPRSLPPGREGILTVFERFGSIQFDPLEVAGRNHDLVLLARVPGYRRELTDALLYEERVLYETYNKGLSIVPTADLPFFRITWDLNRAEKAGGVFDEHAPLVEELLERIRADGHLSSTDMAPRAAIDWYWRPTNQVRAILEALAQSGILGIARRDGNRRIYDLVERLFPADLLVERPPELEQRRFKLLSRYRAHGLLGTGGQAEVWMGTGPGGAFRRERREELIEAGEIVPVTVEGLRGERHVVTGELPLLEQAEREVAAGRSAGPDPHRAPPFSRRSIRSSGTATSFARSTTSTTCGRSTSRRPSGAGATTSYRSTSAIGSSAGSSRGSIARQASFGSSGCGGRTASIRWRPRASSRRSRSPLDAHRRFGGVEGIRFPRTARARAIAAEVRKRID